MKQAEYWNKQGAERWHQNADHLEVALSPISREIIGRLAPTPGAHILDIGCGTGDLAADLAHRVPEGRITGLDISHPLLSRARQKRGARPNLDFLHGDASTWRPDQPAQAVVSRFGIMFFEQPVAAFRNIRAMLAPGGCLVAAAWAGLDQNEWVHTPLQVVLDHLGDRRPETLPVPISGSDSGPGTPGPFSLSAPGQLNSLLEQSGWQDISVTPWTGHLEFTGLRTVEEIAGFMSGMGAVARMIEKDILSRNEAQDALCRFLAPLHEEGTAHIWRAKVWIASAVR
nr:methyltransferase domain-containing protein [uncultured Hyphomonas sp.]